MSTYQSMSVSLHGAMLLARGQARGVLMMDIAPSRVARCLWAIPLSLLPVLYLATLDWPNSVAGSTIVVTLVRESLIFAVAWLAFMVITHRIALGLNRGPLWAPMIVAWAWCNVPENLLMVLGTLPGTLGAPHIVDQVAQIVTFGWALWIEWFAFRVTFRIGPLLAVWLVMIDQSTGLFFTVLDQLPMMH